MQERDQQILSNFKKRLPASVKLLLKKIIVFGSRATGQSTEDSDLDVAILLVKKSSEVERVLENAAYDTMWEFDFTPIISLKVFPENDFDNLVSRGFSFYKRVQNEGILV